MIQTGQLNQRIAFQRATRTTDPAWGTQGKTAMAWATFCTRWAKVVPAADTEKTANEQTVTQAAFDITIRYTPDIDETCRIVWKGQMLQIVAVTDPDNTRHELFISAVFTGGAT